MAIFDDWRIYQEAFLEYMNGINPYADVSFVYFPHFFLLTPIFLNLYVYILFMLVCYGFSFYFAIKLQINKYIIIIFLFLNPIISLNGNIDFFILLVILICLYYKNSYLTPVLLSFVSFKPTLALVLPYFFLKSKSRVKFIIVY
ncbi:MAG: hypothetical protein R6U96_12800, partial [Promethearchaeia archaeon]